MKQILRSIRTHILIGGVLITPLAITLWVILILVDLLSSSKISQWLVHPVMQHVPGRDITAVRALVSLLMALALLFVTGLVFRNFLGRRLYRVLDKIMERTPFINRVYLFVRHVSESVLTQKEAMFRDVVMIEYPRPGMRAIAFLSTKVSASLREKCRVNAEPHVYVFLPTTPNPTSGFLLLVPESQVTPLNMTTTEAMRLIVSAGAAGPGDVTGEPVPSLLEKLEQMVESRKLAKMRPKPEAGPSLNLNDHSFPGE